MIGRQTAPDVLACLVGNWVTTTIRLWWRVKTAMILKALVRIQLVARESF